MENLKFNFKNCLQWIDAIEENFSVPSFNGDFIGRTTIKEHLKITLIGFNDRAMNSYNSDFLAYLTEFYQHWKMQQYHTITKINDDILYLEGKHKEDKEITKDVFIEFFRYNYELINMIKTDIMNSYQSSISETKGKEEEKKIPKSKTLNNYRLKLTTIQHTIEKTWNKEDLKTENKLEKLYLEERKKYAENNNITLTQLNRELKKVDSWNKLKEHIVKHYGQFV